MFESFSPQQWKLTLACFAICAALAAAAVLVGIDDNAVGLSLLIVSALAFVLAFVHPWRTVRRFIALIGASVVLFFVSTLLHNVFGEDSIVGVVFFFVAVFLCPAGILVGIGGAAAAWFRSRHTHHLPPADAVR